jgi:hypothetical protein
MRGLLSGAVWICSYQNLEKNWNLIRTSTLLLFAAKDISLKLTHKKNFPAQNFEPTQPVKDKKPEKEQKV